MIELVNSWDLNLLTKQKAFLISLVYFLSAYHIYINK